MVGFESEGFTTIPLKGLNQKVDKNEVVQKQVKKII